ncbi:uncharacterized protein [Mobula birostris]|uniref:uncharacterized protein n=1 Tax=Mobula birostris TaxID=1983395 RepID=UPI003B27CDF7
MFLLLMNSLLSAVTARPSVPSDTVCGSNACYTAHLDRKPFHQALERCKANGGSLATAKNAEEALLIHKLLAGFSAGQRPKSKFWLGLQLPPRHCYQQHKPLRGFIWTSGGEETTYSNWAREPRSTCTAHRCVHIISSSGSSLSAAGGNYKWHDGACRHGVDGYLCKFSFKGMCPQITLSGPGSATYTTPFDAESSSLTHVPFGSIAVVSCEGGSPAADYMLCKERDPGQYGWSSDGPFCTPPSGCDLDNGGCTQICVSAGGGGGFRCQCEPGYQLRGDQRSCEPWDYCQDQPCEYRCVSHFQGFECLCPVGYQLAENGSSCDDTDECAQRPCAQICINTLGSFRCDCTQGYALIDSQCRDLDECFGHPCDHICQNTVGSYRCFCRAGYRLQETFCVDIDECTTHPCQGTCSNSEGSFQCSCSQGYELAEDGESCIPADVTTLLTSTAQRWDTTAGEWDPTTPGALRELSSDWETSSVSLVGPFTKMGAAAESTTVDWTPVPSPTTAQLSEKHGPASLSWVLMGALGSVAALLLVLCVVGFIICLRNRSPKEKGSNAGDYYSWVQSTEQSPFRASYVRCSRSSDNYIEIEASQTEV